MTAQQHLPSSNTQLTCNCAASMGMGWLAHRVDNKLTHLAESKIRWGQVIVCVTERIARHQAHEQAATSCAPIIKSP